MRVCGSTRIPAAMANPANSAPSTPMFTMLAPSALIPPSANANA